jgi:ribulose-phosphate 3-epimerase
MASEKKTIKIVPSILSADLLQLKEQIAIVENAGADMIHVDIMDGHFVPNITFGPIIVSTLKRITNLPLDVHLMINEPDLYIHDFAKAGASILTIHQEVCQHLHRSIQHIKDQGIQVGVSLNPATDISTIFPILQDLDLILLMTVNPGLGAQKFIGLVLDKIITLAEIKRKNSYRFMIEVDGGINVGTIPAVVQAGAEVLVAGNAIFAQENIAKAFLEIREVAKKTFAKK